MAEGGGQVTAYESGWQMIVRVRASGTGIGAPYNIYVAPSGARYPSLTKARANGFTGE